VLVVGIVLTVSATAGRIWAYSLLAVPLLGAAYIHLRWLPAHGVNGWTGEPKERYLELVANKRGKRENERSV
jgi:predicted small integral membrane protein